MLLCGILTYKHGSFVFFSPLHSYVSHLSFATAKSFQSYLTPQKLTESPAKSHSFCQNIWEKMDDISRGGSTVAIFRSCSSPLVIKPALQAQRALSSSSATVHTFSSWIIYQASFLTQHQSSIKTHYFKCQMALVNPRVLH